MNKYNILLEQTELNGIEHGRDETTRNNAHCTAHALKSFYFSPKILSHTNAKFVIYSQLNRMSKLFAFIQNKWCFCYDAKTKTSNQMLMKNWKEEERNADD